MDKRYQFNVDGKTYFKNVAPQNEEKFLELYGQYEPTLISDEPGKSQGTSQSQNQIPSIVKVQDTDSNLEDGSLEQKESKLFKAVSATMLSNPIGRMMATIYVGGKAFGAAKRGVQDWKVTTKEGREELRKEKEAFKYSEGTYLANAPIKTKSDKPLEYKLDANGNRLYYNPNRKSLKGLEIIDTPGWEEEVRYDYDRSQGVRLRSFSGGKFLDNIAYSVGNAISSSQTGNYTDAMIDLMRLGEEGRASMTEEEAQRYIQALDRDWETALPTE